MRVFIYVATYVGSYIATVIAKNEAIAVYKCCY